MSIFGWGSSQPERTAPQTQDKTIVGGMFDFVSHVFARTTAGGKKSTKYGGECADAVNSAYRRLGDKLGMPELTSIRGDAGRSLIRQYTGKGGFIPINAAAPNVVGDLAYTESRDPKSGDMRYHVATYMIDKKGNGVWVSDAVQKDANPYGGVGTTRIFRNPKLAGYGLTYMQERRGFAPEVSDRDYNEAMLAFNGDNPETNAKVRARYAARHGAQGPQGKEKPVAPVAAAPAPHKHVGGIIGRLFFGEKDEAPAAKQSPAAAPAKARPAAKAGKAAKPAKPAKKKTPAKPNYRAMNSAQVSPPAKPPKPKAAVRTAKAKPVAVPLPVARPQRLAGFSANTI